MARQQRRNERKRRAGFLLTSVAGAAASLLLAPPFLLIAGVTFPDGGPAPSLHPDGARGVGMMALALLAGMLLVHGLERSLGRVLAGTAPPRTRAGRTLRAVGLVLFGLASLALFAAFAFGAFTFAAMSLRPE